MKEERDALVKRRRKEDRAKTTIFGWNVAGMSKMTNFIYLFVMVAIFGATFWFLFKKVAKTTPKDRKTKPKKE